MDYKRRERIIIFLACCITIVIVLGFTIITGQFKSKDQNYISRISNEKNNVDISENDYEIIRKDKKNEVDTFVILEKKKLNKYEIVQLAKIIVKDLNKNFNIYIFDDKEEAKGFNYEDEKIKKVARHLDQQEMQIQTYYTVKKEIESIPKNYSVDLIENKNGKIKISLTLENVKNPESALSQIKFLGEIIKKLNKDKQIESLEIKADSRDYTDLSWEYSSQNKKIIIKNETVEN